MIRCENFKIHLVSYKPRCHTALYFMFSFNCLCLLISLMPGFNKEKYFTAPWIFTQKFKIIAVLSPKVNGTVKRVWNEQWRALHRKKTLLFKIFKKSVFQLYLKALTRLENVLNTPRLTELNQVFSSPLFFLLPRRAQCCKTFLVHSLQMFVISQSFGPWHAFSS